MYGCTQAHYGSFMGAQKIDRDSAMPLWQQVAADLRERITRREWARRMPSQNALAAEYGVNPLTVRKALALLRAEGLVVTYPGSGSEAVPPP